MIKNESYTPPGKPIDERIPMPPKIPEPQSPRPDPDERERRSPSPGKEQLNG